MIFRLLITFVAMLGVHAAFADNHAARQPVVVMDEDIWVTFYDLPSRRFRTIRAAIVNGDSAAAARDLQVTANYLAVEAERTAAVLQTPLTDAVQRLHALSENTDSVTLADLDALYGRVHWLLAQHYLDRAKVARDARQNRNTGLYLLAATHHMERAVLWSNKKVDRSVRKTLDDLRELAGRLQQQDSFERAYKAKPVVRAERLLVKLGKEINRPVLLPVES